MATDGKADPTVTSLSRQMSAKRTEMMVREIETVALRLFHDRGYETVTVQQIATEAHISLRTFYSYFPSKEDLLQVQIDRRCTALRDALSARPVDEAPLHSVRAALIEALAAEDAERTRHWTEIVAAAPTVVRSVLGGIQLKTQQAIAAFLASRLDESADALEPAMLAAATIGIVQATQTQWLFNGGDLASMISASMLVLERGIGSSAQHRPEA